MTGRRRASKRASPLSTTTAGAACERFAGHQERINTTPVSGCQRCLERNVALFLLRVLIALVIQMFERRDQLSSRLARINNLVDKAAAGGNIRVRELLAELLHSFGSSGGPIRRAIELALVQDVHGPLGPHDRD